MSMIIFYVFLAAEWNSDIRFAPTRLDFAAYEVTIFWKTIENQKIIFLKQWSIVLPLINFNVF